MPLPYREDLAYIHDVGHGEFARRAAPGVVELLRARGIESGLVVDLGCGSGIFAEMLTRSGYEVLGIDISPAMVALASKRAPRATFRCESFLRSKLPQCVAVTSISECFNYLFDGARRAIEVRERLFKRIHRALLPNGVLVFDVLTPAALRRRDPPRRFRVGDDWAVLVEIENVEARRQILRKITSFRRIGKLYRRDDELHRVQLFDPGELQNQLRAIGYRTAQLRRYGDMPLAQGHTAIVADKT